MMIANTQNPYKREIRQHHEYYNTKIKSYPNGARLIVNAPYRLKNSLTAEARAELTKEMEYNSNAYWSNLNFDYYDATRDRTLEFKPQRDLSNKHVKDSTKRSKDTIMDISKSNVWNWFGTLTQDKLKVNDRYSYDEFMSELVKFTNALRKRHPSVVYLIILEKHDDGAWHAHMLMHLKADKEFIDTGIRDKTGRVIYTWTKYKLGFTNFTKIDSSEKAASYVAKYMTKENEVPKGKKRYMASKNVKKPTIQYDNVDDEVIADLLKIASYSNEYTRTLRNYATGQTNDVTYRYITINSQTL